MIKAGMALVVPSSLANVLFNPRLRIVDELTSLAYGAARIIDTLRVIRGCSFKDSIIDHPSILIEMSL